jgi:hypothetical protein
MENLLSPCLIANGPSGVSDNNKGIQWGNRKLMTLMGEGGFGGYLYDENNSNL